MPFALDYAAPPTCPDEITLRAGVIARVGHDPFDANATDHIVVRIEETPRGFIATVATPGGEPRSIRGASCNDAVDALELDLAMVVDPAHAAPPTVYAPAPYVAPPPAIGTGWPPPPPPPEHPKRELALAFGSVSGSFPSSAFSFGVRAGYVLPEWRLGLVARIGTQEGDLADMRHVRTQTVELVAEGCVRRWLAMACALAGVGSKSVRVDHDNGDFTITNEADYRDPYALVGVDASLDVPLGRAFLRPTVEADVPLPQVEIASLGVQRADLSVLQLGFDLAIGLRW